MKEKVEKVHERNEFINEKIQKVKEKQLLERD